MPLQTYFANEYAQIQVSRRRHYLELEWFAHPDSSTFRAIHQQAQEYALYYQVTKWLCDIQKADFLELADQQWLVQQIFPTFPSQYQHQYACLILPLVGEIVTAYHLQELVEQDAALNRKLHLAIFTEYDVAQHWLFSPFP